MCQRAIDRLMHHKQHNRMNRKKPKPTEIVQPVPMTAVAAAFKGTMATEQKGAKKTDFQWILKV